MQIIVTKFNLNSQDNPFHTESGKESRILFRQHPQNIYHIFLILSEVQGRQERVNPGRVWAGAHEEGCHAQGEEGERKLKQFNLQFSILACKVKSVKAKKGKKKKKDNQRKERKATQTLAIVLGKKKTNTNIKTKTNTKRQIQRKIKRQIKRETQRQIQRQIQSQS